MKMSLEVLNNAVMLKKFRKMRDIFLNLSYNK